MKKATGPSSTSDRRAAIARARVWLHCHGRRISGLLAAGLAVAPVVLLSAGATSQAADTGTITIHIPSSEVGSSTAGTLLTIPQAVDQLDAGTPAVSVDLTTDSADDLVPVSQDQGASVSIGQAVKVSP